MSIQRVYLIGCLLAMVVFSVSAYEEAFEMVMTTTLTPVHLPRKFRLQFNFAVKDLYQRNTGNEYTIWSEWSSCNCTSNLRISTRKCVEGSVCNGETKHKMMCSLYETYQCDMKKKEERGKWLTWSDWSTCDCSLTIKTRTRLCEIEGTCVGTDKETRRCLESEQRDCFNDMIKEDNTDSPKMSTLASSGLWLRWSTWTDCNCETYTKTRNRTCSVENQEVCVGEDTQSENCIIAEKMKCLDNNSTNSFNDTVKDRESYGKWSTWTSWSSCNCNNLKKNRIRMCSVPNTCVGLTHDAEDCSSDQRYQCSLKDEVDMVKRRSQRRRRGRMRRSSRRYKLKPKNLQNDEKNNTGHISGTVFNIYGNKVHIHIAPQVTTNKTTASELSPTDPTTKPAGNSLKSRNFLAKLLSINDSVIYANYTTPSVSQWIRIHSQSPRSIVLFILFFTLCVLVCLYFLVAFPRCCKIVCSSCCCCCCCCQGNSSNSDLRGSLHSSSGDTSSEYVVQPTNLSLANESLNKDRIERRRLLLSMPEPPASRRTTLKQTIIDKYKNKRNNHEEVQRLWSQK